MQRQGAKPRGESIVAWFASRTIPPTHVMKSRAMRAAAHLAARRLIGNATSNRTCETVSWTNGQNFPIWLLQVQMVAAQFMQQSFFSTWEGRIDGRALDQLVFIEFFSGTGGLCAEFADSLWHMGLEWMHMCQNRSRHLLPA